MNHLIETIDPTSRKQRTDAHPMSVDWDRIPSRHQDRKSAQPQNGLGRQSRQGLRSKQPFPAASVAAAVVVDDDCDGVAACIACCLVA